MKPLRALAAVLALFAGLMLGRAAVAHEVRPALLEITQADPQSYVLVWKQPAMADMVLRLNPRLSSGWLDRPPDDQYAAPGFLIRTWTVSQAGSLEGQRLTIEGLEGTITDVLVQIRLLDGEQRRLLIRPQSPSVTLNLAAAPELEAPAYFRLGVEHIAGGLDHLMFVLALLLLVGLRWRILGAVTAFTVGHSLTLAAAALGWVQAPSQIIEALVALSIVLVAVEVARSRLSESTLLRRRPWLVALLFGLLHGFAFAGALSDIGLPRQDLIAALLLFNLGVEAGQILFVAIAVAAWLGLRRIGERAPGALVAGARLAPAYLIGPYAAFLFLDRLGAAFQ